MSEIVRIVGRKGAIMAASPKQHMPVRAAAEALSRRNVAQAKAEVLSEALWALVTLCYEADDTGALCNVDGATGRLLVPAPMGRVGHRRWGLRYTESEVLRAILMGWQRARGEPPLLTYDSVSRGWHLNIFDYATHPAALGWLQRHPITAGQWRSAYAVWSGSDQV
jgi:hypothetical protein